ncbi:tetratricopeptide repeat protein 16 isoform X1 [Pongo pygmaeus]|uniref:TTC16 isoform 1 n=1 Tax=Pongo abelii TaxID=9601 RepID=H2PTG2_PONAB|nr:tetratricopeptide repeat protein 16 isoform X1 [Pongo abelii]XP_054357318.1 tetratricopeptide repeat protein 16 isoform X2 [Pongo pygmaeus]PNJ45681.1 TTC16 isoform 1 [Pongo abelii]
MTDSDEDALKVDQGPSQDIPKPWVIPAPKGILQHIFGTSQVFQSICDVKPKAMGLTVPLKVREYYSRGQECLEQADWETAVLFFSRALHLDPQLVDFYALRAEAYLQLCDFSSAAQNLRRAYSLQQDNCKHLERLTFVLYLQGQCLFEQCAFLDALNVFSHAAELQPEKPCFRYRCMACLLALKQHQACLSLITNELKQDTTNADVYILRARLYNFLQKPRLCYRDLHSALLLNPKHPQARMLLQKMVAQAQQARQDAGILAVQGKLQHALQQINCAIENNPLDPSLFLFRGTMYRRLQEFDGAVEDFLKMLDMVTEDQEDMVRQAQRQLLLTYNDFAVHCYRQGAYQEGVLLLNKALRDEQQEKGLYINRGDCFFQLGNLAFAEADYQQALALSPQDEGANTRMGLLQEKMGFCEQRRRQFQKAEDHFSTAIRHNPQKAQYYLYRAKSRQLLQNIFGARQDVATVLLLNPKQPKLSLLMTNLFPGMSVEEVLSTQIAHLARLQLERMVEGRLQAGSPQGIVGMLKQQELECQKALALQRSWKQGEPLIATSEELKATPEIPQVELGSSEGEAEAPKEEEEKEKEKKEEKKSELIPSKVVSLSDSYLDQTSSASSMSFRTTCTSETETSAICQEYRSTSATAVTFSDSSLLKTQSSDSGNNREALSHGPRKIKATQGQRQSFSKTEATQSQRQNSSKTKATIQKRNSSKTKATQGQGQSSSKTEATQGQRQSSREIEATQGPRQEPSNTKTTRSPRQRPRKVKAARGRSWRPSKVDATQGRSRGLLRSSTKTEAFYDSNWSLSKTEDAQGQGQRPSKAEAAQGKSQGRSSTSSKADSTWGPSPSLSKNEVDQDLTYYEAV